MINTNAKLSLLKGSVENSYGTVDVGLLGSRFCETSVSTYKPTRHYNPEDQHRHLHRCENLKSHIVIVGYILDLQHTYFLFQVFSIYGDMFRY
jgi:hypothetical protein